MTRRVFRHALPGWVDPAAVFVAMADRARPLMWLDAGPEATEGLSYLVLDANGQVALDALDLPAVRRVWGERTVGDTVPGRFNLGLIGWFGYEAGAKAQGVSTRRTDTPGVALVSVTAVLEFDHGAQSMTVVHDGGVDVAGVLSLLDAADKTGVARQSDLVGLPAATWRHDDAGYAALVRECQQRIRSGDAFQLCLTNTATVAHSLNRRECVLTYLRLRAENPSHHGGFVDIAGTTLLSSTPEIFLRVSADGVATTKPIKGTRPRGNTVERDEALRAELADNVKEQAENVMIVDLMRNDLSRVALAGTVSVDDLLAVETYANVHQLVSTVSARLRPEVDALDAFAACFPAGSMTGAPKIAAMQILHDLERGPRGVYSGAYGYLGWDGAMEMAVIIRSIVNTPSGITIGSGGGITSDSAPESEVAEMHLKVAPLLRALGAPTTPVI